MYLVKEYARMGTIISLVDSKVFATRSEAVEYMKSQKEKGNVTLFSWFSKESGESHWKLVGEEIIGKGVME